MSTEIQEQTHPPASQPPKRISKMLGWRIAFFVVFAAAAIPLYRAVRVHAKADTTSGKIPPVAVVKVSRADLAQELIVDAELRPYQEIELHAKVAGYLESISVDIGDHVEAGQLLAVIEVPELADDITRTEAMQKRSEQEVTRAEAAYEETHLAYVRLVAVEKSQPNLIAQQDLDAAQGKDRVAAATLAATKSQVDVARAEVSKLRTMLKYSRITAPFAGVITRRFADPGALIQAGTASSTQALPLVRLSQNDRLRLVFPVSVSHVARIKMGDPAQVHVESSSKPFLGTIARSTHKVDSATRKMEIEVDVLNRDMALVPGMYASVTLKLDRRERALAVPVEALARGQTTTVFVVNRENHIEERPLALGLETPSKIEVLSGLNENELVMIGNRTQVKPGQLVAPKLISATNAP
ncbi:MAG: efflux RND transporter periplasmic adaptor subunit [Verrucomicrobia bacterium]|nr:efflux RND transporter periplasmic adaptor subunit [Verrucomicrobiota bacterium]